MYVPILITALASDSSIKPPPLRRLTGRIQTKRKRPGSRPSQVESTQDSEGNRLSKARVCRYCGRYAINNHNSVTCPKRKRDDAGEVGGSDAEEYEEERDESQDPVAAYFQHRHAADELIEMEENEDDVESSSSASQQEESDSTNDDETDGASNRDRLASRASTESSSGHTAENLIRVVLQNEARRQATTHNRQSVIAKHKRVQASRHPEAPLSQSVTRRPPPRRTRMRQGQATGTAPQDQAVANRLPAAASSIPPMTRRQQSLAQTQLVADQSKDQRMIDEGWVWNSKGAGAGMYARGYWGRLEARD